MLFNRNLVKKYNNETFCMDDKNDTLMETKFIERNDCNDEMFCKLCMVLFENSNKCVFLTTNNGRLFSARPQYSPFSFFYIFFTLFTPVYTFTAFESPLVLFSWWRNKIS